MKSQNATATIGNVTSCAGEVVLVPLDVLNFEDIGAMTFYIGYDTNTASYLSIQNINPAIPGSFSINEVNGQINIAYSSISSFTILDDKLFDIRFSFFGDSCEIHFKPGTEIANPNLEVIPLDTVPGSIANSIQITNQPDSVKSYPDNDVIFRVTSLGSPDYQWQENTGSGWTDLQNNGTYSGVTNDTLVIHDVTLAFNGYTYRCELTEDQCTEISDVALLEVALAFPVATLGYINSCPENNVLEPVLVGDFLDVVEFTFNISFDTAVLEFLNLENIHPTLDPGDLTVSPLTDPPGVTIHWINASPISITSDKLFDMAFQYESGDRIFAFEDGTEVLNSFLNPLNITLNNGAVTQYQAPVISAQPQNDTVTEPQNASFFVEASETTGYLWHVSTDDGETWTGLTDAPPYSNVQTETLTISPAVYEMNGYRYACLLENDNCSLYSSSALLVVDTLTYINYPENKLLLQVYPVPFRDNITLSLPGGFRYNYINIYNVNGIRVGSFKSDDSGEQKLNLELSTLPAGLFLVNATGSMNGKAVVLQKSIMKIN